MSIHADTARAPHVQDLMPEAVDIAEEHGRAIEASDLPRRRAPVRLRLPAVPEVI
jgi:hypothetical protein